MADDSRGLVRASAARTVARVQNAYGAFVRHAVRCSECGDTGARCSQAEGLWLKYKDARREAKW